MISLYYSAWIWLIESTRSVSGWTDELCPHPVYRRLRKYIPPSEINSLCMCALTLVLVPIICGLKEYLLVLVSYV